MSDNSVYSRRRYNIVQVSQAKEIAKDWLNDLKLDQVISFGLPEADDRYHIWRVPLLNSGKKEKIGEVVIDAFSTKVIQDKTTKEEVLRDRISHKFNSTIIKETKDRPYRLSELENTIAHGDSEHILSKFPKNSIDLVFTSPPYYNARPEYSEYVSYEDYLLKMRKIIRNIHGIMNEGRFFVMNISPVLIRRASRSQASKRIAVPFDMHRIFIEEGFDFIDDIIWVKPEGAGWATGRGRRFAADRNPLQYKTVPVTEHILVYRKQTDKLIDWNIRNHPDQIAIKDSKILGEYEKTDVWKIKPAHTKKHPAVFPLELAEKVIKYYSFKNDVVLDPFGGIGTVGQAASKLGRRFALVEYEKKYADIICKEAKNWLYDGSDQICYINCKPSGPSQKRLI